MQTVRGITPAAWPAATSVMLGANSKLCHAAHFFTNVLFVQTVNTEYLHHSNKEMGQLHQCMSHATHMQLMYLSHS